MCVTGRREYKNPRSARSALADIRVQRDERRKRRRREQSIFFCKLCRGFHLTIEPLSGDSERFR